MTWLEMAGVALAVDLALIVVALVLVRQAMRRMMPPGLVRAPVKPREDPVAAP